METIKIEVTLSLEVLAVLQHEADQRHLSIDTIISEVLTDYAEESDEEILAGIVRGLQEALRGEGRPAREFLDEIVSESAG